MKGLIYVILSSLYLFYFSVILCIPGEYMTSGKDFTPIPKTSLLTLRNSRGEFETLSFASCLTPTQL